MKKKGLIISTIVMVVVLIASLTTATYAWFSSQSSATVDNLAITTKAGDGLQIAMRNTNASPTNQYVSGTLDYNAESAGDKWTGDANDFGANLGFGNIAIGEMKDAITFKSTGNYDVFKGYTSAASDTFSSTGNYYVLGAEASEWSTEAPYYLIAAEGGKPAYYAKASAAVSGVSAYFPISKVDTPNSEQMANYYKIYTESEAVPEGGAYLVPTGYDSSINPTGFAPAEVNGNYYYLTMAIKPVTNVTGIAFTLKVTPTQNGVDKVLNTTSTDGYMAAATRIKVETSTAADPSTVHTANLAPFSSYYYNKSNGSLSNLTSADYASSTRPTTDSNGAFNSDGNYLFTLASTNVNSGSIIFVTFTIWIEGTDTECVQSTAGGGCKLDINFLYVSETNATSIAQQANTALGVESIDADTTLNLYSA